MPKKKENVVGPGGVSVCKTSADNDFLKACQLWVGGPGTGKTSTASALGEAAKNLKLDGCNPFVLWFESGSTDIEVNGSTQVCPDCGGAKAKDCDRCAGSGVIPLVLGAVEGEDPMSQITEWFEWAASSEFNPLIIDTANAYFLEICTAMCLKNQVPSMGRANDHGATWTDVFNAVRFGHATLRQNGKALIYLTHAYERVKRTRNGEISEMVFHISGASRNFLKGAATQILHFDTTPADNDDEMDKAVIHCNPYAGVEAKDRWNILDDEIDRGRSAVEGAEAILKQFYDV